jgi:effector-binding domain-containing protein
MNKKVLLSVIFLALIISCLIPVSQQKSILIGRPLLNIYSFLDNPQKWEDWHPMLKGTLNTDSNKIIITRGVNSFQIKSPDFELDVKSRGTAFDIREQGNNGNANYTYYLMPVMDGYLNKTIASVERKTIAIKYLIGKIWPATFSDYHLFDLKHFLLTDSLYYGYKIVKTRVPEGNLIVIKRGVPKKYKFTEAAKMLALLQQYLKIKNIKQMQPVIAQFLEKGKDSSQVNVGLFVDRQVNSENEIKYVRMPVGGPLYVAQFKGPFDKRQKVYNGLQQYFADHLYQSAVLPFETYLDNKLPTSDTDKVNIRVNFTAYF